MSIITDDNYLKETFKDYRQSLIDERIENFNTYGGIG